MKEPYILTHHITKSTRNTRSIDTLITLQAHRSISISAGHTSVRILRVSHIKLILTHMTYTSIDLTSLTASVTSHTSIVLSRVVPFELANNIVQITTEGISRAGKAFSLVVYSPSFIALGTCLTDCIEYGTISSRLNAFSQGFIILKANLTT